MSLKAHFISSYTQSSVPLIQATRKDGSISRTIYDCLITNPYKHRREGKPYLQYASCKKAEVWGKREGEKRLERRYGKIQFAHYQGQLHCFPQRISSPPTSASEQGSVWGAFSPAFQDRPSTLFILTWMSITYHLWPLISPSKWVFYEWAWPVT